MFCFLKEITNRRLQVNKTFIPFPFKMHQFLAELNNPPRFGGFVSAVGGCRLAV